MALVERKTRHEARRRHPIRGRLISLAAVILLLASASGGVSHLLLRSLESQYPARPLDVVPDAQAIVVLGGGLVNLDADLLQLGGDAERLWRGAVLYRAGKAPVILVAGGSEPGDVPESAAASRILQAWGIPARSILTEEKSRNTYQNALFSHTILSGRGINRIILVTSAFHMMRASATFRHAGFDVIPFATDYHSYDTHSGPSLFPSAGALADSTRCLKEWLGLEVYHLRGWD